jgi:hypothetical protein
MARKNDVIESKVSRNSLLQPPHANPSNLSALACIDSELDSAYRCAVKVLRCQTDFLAYNESSRTLNMGAGQYRRTCLNNGTLG